MAGKTLADGYVELRLDDSKLEPETRAKVQKVTAQFGNRLNQQLKRLNLDPIDIDADPRDAIRAIDEADRRLKRLNAEAPTIDVKIRTQDAMAELSRLRRRIGDVGDQSGTGFAARLSARLGPLLGSLPISEPLAGAVAAAGAAAAPLLASALAGGIIGSVGLGGIVGGFAVVKDDARVKAAINDLGGELERRLQRASGSFIRPALDGVAVIDKALQAVDIDAIFADAGSNVDDLAAGAGSAIESIGNAIKELSAVSGPVIAAISAGIAGIGRQLGEGLELLADNSEDAAAALTTMFEIIGSGIYTTLVLVNALVELYSINRKIGGDAGLRLMLRLTGSEMDNVDKSARRTGSGTFGMGENFQKAADDAEDLKKQQEELKKVQDAVKKAQDQLQWSLDGLGGKSTVAAQRAAALTQAMDNLYGASIRQTEANEAFEDSFDSLSETVKANSSQVRHNKDNLDLHTKAGRSNRDALQDLLTKNNELYIADINAGVATDVARRKHEARTKAVQREAEKVGLNKKETDKLIGTYGRIPPKKATDLILSGVDKIAKTLYDLYVFQRALAEGIPVASMAAKLRNEKGPAKRFGGYAAGGFYDGMLPGPPSRVDNLLGYGPGGDVFGLAGGEFIVNPKQTAKHRPVLEAINSGLDGYSAGGYYPVDTSRRWPFIADMSGTKLMSRAQAEAKVTPAFSGGGPTIDFMVRVVRAAFPGLHLISGYRPGARTLSGNQSYHALRRATDWPASRALAEWINQHYKSRTKELITPWNSLNIHNGQRHTYTGDVYAQHAGTGRFRGNAHDHWAMDDGGFRTLMPGVTAVMNGTGKPELIGGPNAMRSIAGSTYNINVQVPPTAHPAEVGRHIITAIQAHEKSNGTRWRQ